MKLVIEPTREIVFHCGTACRVWQGRTAAGVPCTAYVTLVRVDQADDCTEFDRDLIDVAPPDPRRNEP